jgi:hypothetical protein
MEIFFPPAPVAFFHAGQRARHAPPGVIHGLVVHPVAIAEAVLAVPDVAGDFGNEGIAGHIAQFCMTPWSAAIVSFMPMACGVIG